MAIESYPKPELILASASPYRAQLLSRLGLPFRQIAAGCDETPLPDEAPAAIAKRLARSKARAVANAQTSALVIGSDQVAEIDGDALGKPGSMDDARAQLARCSGRVVSFHTALCVLCPGTSGYETMDLTRVCFRRLHCDEVDRYLAAERVLDCAGSFKCEGLGISLIERIESTDPTALVGLPLIALASSLRACGIILP